MATKILHAFADCGSECRELSAQGHVTRVGIDPNDNEWTDALIEMDLLDDAPAGEFDLGLFHPVCTRWASQTSISGDPDDHPDMIPRARELADRCCDEWIIENVPAAPLDDPVILDARMFEPDAPIQYRRAFETSFDVEQPARYGALDEPETSPHYHSERSREWWSSVKGYPATHAPKEHLAKNCLPAAYVRYLLRSWLDATGRAEGPGRNYDGYHDEMHRKRAAESNHALGEFVADGGTLTRDKTDDREI